MQVPGNHLPPDRTGYAACWVIANSGYRSIFPLISYSWRGQGEESELNLGYTPFMVAARYGVRRWLKERSVSGVVQPPVGGMRSMTPPRHVRRSVRQDVAAWWHQGLVHHRSWLSGHQDSAARACVHSRLLDAPLRPKWRTMNISGHRLMLLGLVTGTGDEVTEA